MVTRKVKILATLAVSITLVLITVGNGCSKRSNVESVSSLNPNNSGLGGGAQPDPDFIEGARVASVEYGDQALTQLTSCVGVNPPSDATLLMYENKKSSLSVNGDVKTVTPPMMMAIISIAGEICNDLITQERALATKRIFVGYDFNSNSLPAANDIANAMSRLAVSCWQRQENTQERANLNQLLATIANGNAGATRDSALVMCTAVVASLKSLLN